MVYRRVHPRLWRSLLAFGADSEVAGDAIAEAFTQVIARGAAVRDVEAWVWRASFRIATGMLAQRSSTDPLPLDLDGVIDSPLVEFLGQLQLLSEQQRAVVVLRYVGRMPPAEIADVLGTTAGTVRVQLHRAHAALRVTMEDQDGR